MNSNGALDVLASANHSHPRAQMNDREIAISKGPCFVIEGHRARGIVEPRYAG